MFVLCNISHILEYVKTFFCFGLQSEGEGTSKIKNPNLLFGVENQMTAVLQDFEIMVY